LPEFMGIDFRGWSVGWSNAGANLCAGMLQRSGGIFDEEDLAMVKGWRWVGSLVLAGMVLGLGVQARAQKWVKPGAVWHDVQGNVIEAHGGGILHYGGVWYWFGTDRNPKLDRAKRYVRCYSSRDLMHWKDRGEALVLADPEHLGAHWKLERPKVYYSPATRKFVMYMHLDDAHYKYAHVGVAVSDKVTGPYHFVEAFRPLGMESRDIGQFVDDDGQAYLIFESRRTGGFFVARLSADRLKVERPAVAFVPAPLEGGALVHYKGLYYVMGSHMSGWRPNPNVYATAKRLGGPWTKFREIAPGSKDTYGSQSTFLLKVKGTRRTTVIFMGDEWRPRALWDSRYLWMPLEMKDGGMLLRKPEAWRIDAKTGVVTVK
jgi:hypothetical protein